jgi:hypothetical protein
MATFFETLPLHLQRELLHAVVQPCRGEVNPCNGAPIDAERKNDPCDWKGIDTNGRLRLDLATFASALQGRAFSLQSIGIVLQRFALG